MSNPRWIDDEPARRVAFLGIDGVLYPQTHCPPDSIESLRGHIDASVAIELMDCLSTGRLDVVVHSHWRTRLTRVQLLELLSLPDGGFGGTSGGCAFCGSGSFLVGTTLSTQDGAAGIRDAVARMRLGADDYFVIDTDPNLLAAFTDQAVPCDASRGIDDAFIDTLCERVGVTLVRA
jgi:hypothetical protein